MGIGIGVWFGVVGMSGSGSVMGHVGVGVGIDIEHTRQQRVVVEQVQQPHVAAAAAAGFSPPIQHESCVVAESHQQVCVPTLASRRASQQDFSVVSASAHELLSPVLQATLSSLRPWPLLFPVVAAH